VSQGDDVHRTGEAGQKVNDLEGTASSPTNGLPARASKGKRSTERGEARNKIIGGLTEHHQYSRGSCLNMESISVSELARKADVSKSTVSQFFQKDFKGHARYRALCRDVSRLVGALKLLRGEFAPRDLYGKTPPGEGHHDDD
jgi:hypothetical protein